MLSSAFPHYRSLYHKEEKILDRARVKILSTLITLYAALFTSLSLFYIAQERNYLLLRAGFVAVILILNFFLLVKGINWRRIAHAFIFCITIMIWTNILFIKQGINLVTGQYVVLIVTCGFYLLEERWGLIYSIFNIVPLVVFVFLNDYFGSIAYTQFQTQNSTAYHVILVFNFAALLYTHYFFFREYKIATFNEKEQRFQLNKALKAANYTAQEKTNFLATMSHELRTPLNAVIGMTNVLITEEHLAAQKENLNILQFSAENLMAIINDILDFNKIDAGKVEISLTDFRLDTLLENLCGTFHSKADAKGITFECKSARELNGKMLRGDQTRLTQILFNLIGNAVKFTQEGYVKVKTEVTYKTKESIEITFRITDTGIGIPQENIASIYEPYTRSEARTNRQYHGTGLGLTIAKKLVELLGGELHLHSKEGVGTSFAFTLPLEEVNGVISVTDSLPLEINKDLSELKVLVAEDNPVNVLVLQKILKNWSIVPDVASDGKQAVDAVVDKSYDVILMDINMPVMDGFEASKMIRELNDMLKAKVPIIAVTASVGASIEHHQGYQYLSDCLLKPFKPEDLRTKLLKVCVKK